MEVLPLRGDARTARLREYQRWDYITLSDFHSHSCGTYLSYVWLWFLALVSVAVYGTDTYTAVNLLAFSRWSSTFQPAISLDISKWIFSGCIILSWILVAYKWFRATGIMRRGNVAESYLDPLALRIQSMRVVSGGQGFRRFLVFKRLTDSKKGADYIALFTYFQLQNALSVVLAEGPRQVVNAITLYSLLQSDLLSGVTGSSKSSKSPFDQFWLNIKILYDDSPEQAIIMFTMLFTLVIWVFSALCFFVACMLYVGFLWHYIPKEFGGLNKYCRKKVDKRLSRVMNDIGKHALENEEKQRRKDEEKYGGGRPLPPSRAPTLPTIADYSAKTPSVYPKSVFSGDARPSLPRSDSSAFPARQPTLPNLDAKVDAVELQPTLPQLGEVGNYGDPLLFRPNAPLRSDTQSSAVSLSSYGSNRPLLENAADMNSVVSPLDRNGWEVDSFDPDGEDPGYPPNAMRRTETSRSGVPMGNGRGLPANITRKPAPIRSMTGTSKLSNGPSNPPSRPPTAQSYDGSFRDAARQPMPPPSAFVSTHDEPAYEMQATYPAQRAPPLRQESYVPYRSYSPYRPQDADRSRTAPPAPSGPTPAHRELGPSRSNTAPAGEAFRQRSEEPTVRRQYYGQPQYRNASLQ